MPRFIYLGHDYRPIDVSGLPMCRWCGHYRHAVADEGRCSGRVNGLVDVATFVEQRTQRALEAVRAADRARRATRKGKRR